MNFQHNFIHFGLIILLTTLVSCSESGTRQERGQNGLVELHVQNSEHYFEYQKASALLQENNFSEAISVYRGLCKVEDDSLQTYAYMGLASAYLMSGDYQNAIENYNNSIALNDRNFGSYVGLGSVYYRLEEYEKATQFYNHAKAINPDSPDCHWGLALSYDKLNLEDSAKANAKRFIELEPNSNYRSLAERIIAK